jgi:hypothetical protein
MTLIPDLTAKSSVTGSEEFLVSSGTVDYKVTATQITAAITAAHNSYVITNDAAVAALDSGKLTLAGGTMTGLLTLSGAPTSGLHATTKTYVDTLLAAKADATGQSFDATTTGVTASDTTESTALATTAHVASKIKYDILKKTTVNTSTVSLVYADRGNIFVTRTTTGTCTITLPDSSGLTDAEKTEYYIVDAGYNAETYNIIINCAGSDTFLDGTTTMSITGDGASVLLAVTGTTWVPKDLDAVGTTTVAGTSRLATNAEALALTNATAVITPSELGNVFDQEIYNSTVISAASKTFVEGDSGKWYVTRTATGTCALTLPDPSALTTASRFVIEIWDVETAGTNAITINTTAGNIDGASSATINVDKAGMVFINDGTNYYTIANTQRAASTSASLNAVLTSSNTTSGKNIILTTGDAIKPSSGNGVFTYDSSTALISTSGDLTATRSAHVRIDKDTLSIGQVTSGAAVGVTVSGQDWATGNPLGIYIPDNIASNRTGPTVDTYGMIIGNGGSSVINSGVTNSVIIGGISPTTASADDTVYVGDFLNVKDTITGQAGILSSSQDGGVGYTTGAGGTVTQATNRTTGVTLSRITGQITTNTTSLAAGAAATFTVTNTTVAATDVIHLSISSGETTNQTNVRTTGVAAGSFDITVENNHASTAETGAIVINFAVIKGVTS